jgi:hypothetical protein
VILVVLILWNSPVRYTATTAVSAGTHSYSPADYNYYFNQLVNSDQTFMMYYYYGMVDPAKPLSQQQYTETQTWEEYFSEKVVNTLMELSMLYDAGKAEGYAVPTEGEDAPVPAATQIANLKSSSGAKDFDEYLSATYGKGMTEERLLSILDKSVFAFSYQSELIKRQTDAMTDDVRDAKYNEVATDYDLTTFYEYKVVAELDPEVGTTTDATRAAALDKVNAIAATHNAEMFGQAVYDLASESEKETYRNLDATRRDSVAPGALNELYADWLKAAGRAEGDTEIFPEGDDYTVILFVERDKNQYHRSTFRDIVISVQAGEDGSYSTEASAEAKATAEQALSDWRNGDATEDTFATLANERSDNAQNSDGGLMSNAIKGNYAYELEDWLFDTARQPGDTEIIYVKSNSTPAYHVVYYVSAEEQRYDRYIAENLILSEYYNAWKTERVGEYATRKGFGYRFRAGLTPMTAAQ